jgi:hypothetical protein
VIGAVIPALRLREARPLLVAALLVALAAAALGAAQSWPMLGGGGVRVDALAASEAPAVHERLPLAQFLRWRRRLRPTDRWWLDVPEGASVGMTDRGEVYRTFAFYWFLPALPASSPRTATVVFRLSAVP